MTALWLIICGFTMLYATQAEFPPSKKTIFSPEKPCTPGKVYRQSCNLCKCDQNSELICSKMACPEDIKLLYPRGVWNKNNNISPHPSSIGNIPKKCTPGKIYKISNYLCFCDFRGKVRCSSQTFEGKLSLAQIRSPDQVYPSLTDDEFVELPSLDHTASECAPGRVYRVECDLCLCMQDGNTLCTDLLCLPQQGVNRKQAARVNGQPCNMKKELKNECVNCECVNDLLQCAPVPGCKPVLRNLHGPKREDLFLDLPHDKCTPNETLVDKCNVCHCQDNGTLRCTQRTCLTYTETQDLKEEIEKLEKNGS